MITIFIQPFFAFIARILIIGEASLAVFMTLKTVIKRILFDLVVTIGTTNIWLAIPFRVLNKSINTERAFIFIIRTSTEPTSPMALFSFYDVRGIFA